MSTKIEILKDEIQEDLDLDTKSNPLTLIMDLSKNIDIRIQAMEDYYDLVGNDGVINVIYTLNGMYQISGSNLIQQFLYKICSHSMFSSFIKLEAAKSLLDYEEFEEKIDKYDNEVEKENKKQLNIMIKKKNEDRKKIGYKALDFVCYDLNDLPTPCRVEAIFKLMNCKTYDANTQAYFREFIRDDNIDSEFKYKSILSLENINNNIIVKKLLKEYDNFKFIQKFYKENHKFIFEIVGKYTTKSKKEFYKILSNLRYKNLKRIYINFFGELEDSRESFIKNGQITFLYHKNNDIYYRILAAQYLLQNFILEQKEREKVELELINFATNKDNEYNRRADSTDILLFLGSEKNKIIAQKIIIELGMKDGQSISIFDNAQNVHTKEVEKSVLDILEFFSSLPLMNVCGKPINFKYVSEQIHNILKLEFENISNKNKKEVSQEFREKICEYCKNYVVSEFKSENSIFCSVECYNSYNKTNKIKMALNRISIDRALYSKFNNSLVNILLKVWTYIMMSECKDELIIRVLQELEEMSDTCSSGFASRLLNSLSGFGDFSIKISWEDQIIANFSGRINSFVRKIDCFTDDNPFFNEQLENVIELWLNENPYEKDKYGYNLSDKLLDSSKPITTKEIVKEFLKTENSNMIQNCITNFKENVLNEMIIDSSNYSLRQNFSLFFRTYMPLIKEELYFEFNNFVTDGDFDLYFKKAIMKYQGDI